MRRLLTLLIIIPLTTFCQNTDTTNTREISIGLTYSPDYCYRTLRHDAWRADNTKARDNCEFSKFGYTTGINFTLKINKRITLEIGLLYSDMGYKTKYESFIFDTTWTQLFPETQAITNITYQYIYFNIPIKAQYYILTRKAKLFLTAGLSPNIFLVQKTTLIFEYSDGHTETNTSTGSSELTTINLTAIAGFGFSYDLTSKLFLKIEPIYRQSLTSIINAPIKEYLYSVGLNTGFYYRL